jgi:probable F420-dependent oxidoreductase
MKVDTSMVLTDPATAGEYAQRLEQRGYQAAFSFEGQHDPFLPLVLASQTTSSIQLGTGIAVGFARNPMNLAYLGNDLQLMTKGRFVMGLGTQIQAHVEKRFSMPWSKPASRMKEMISAIRAIWQSWETGERLRFEGEFYRHTLMNPAFNPGPNPYGTARIVAAGVGPKMTTAVSEVADGFTIHPFNTRESLKQITLPAIAEGLKKNEYRQGFEVSCSTIIASGDNEQVLSDARNKVRHQIAFYGSTPAYKPILDCHGWGDMQPQLNQLSKEGKWEEMAQAITDEMVDAIAIVAPREEIAPRIREKLADIEGLPDVDRVNLIARYTTDDRDWEDIVRELQG